MFGENLKPQFERFLFHEYGHIIAGYYNNEYHGFETINSLTVNYTSFGEFVGQVNTSQKVEITDANRAYRIMGNISGCLFQNYKESQNRLKRKFEDCFCFSETKINSQIGDCAGGIDKHQLGKLILPNSINKGEYLKCLVEYIAAYEQTYIAALYSPFYQLMENKKAEFWKAIKENCNKVASVQGYDFDYGAKIKSNLDVIVTQAPELKDYYDSFARGLWPLNPIK